jgi:hypothetical protein
VAEEDRVSGQAGNFVKERTSATLLAQNVDVGAGRSKIGLEAQYRGLLLNNFKEIIRNL